MKTRALTTKIRAKKPKNTRNCERSARASWRGIFQGKQNSAQEKKKGPFLKI
jgi:hypothetical protein